MRGLLRAARVAVASCVLVGGLLTGMVPTPAVTPVPECAGERATHVLVDPGDAQAYADMWPDVDVQANEDGVLRGTEGRDVLVALVETDDGGIISDPRQDGAGDVMCGSDADDRVYATRNAGDVIITRGGEDTIYAGGGPDFVRAGPGIDRIWGFTVAAGQTQVIHGGADQDHLYVGKGRGSVVAFGGSSPTGVAGGGDHIHPCPPDGTGGDVEAHGIEYVGREDAFTDQPFDPCAYGERGLH